MKDNIIKIPLADRIIVLRIEDFESEIPTDDLINIDYGNILGEILTFPVLMNRIGGLRAEAENAMSVAKFKLEICRAELSEKFRKNNVTTKKDYRGKDKLEKPTKDEVEAGVVLDVVYQKSRYAAIASERNYNYIDGLYWAAKSKDKKLDILSKNIVPEEFEKELIESVINGIKIKVCKKIFK